MADKLNRFWRLLALACGLFPLLLSAQSNALWRDQSIYQIFTDRFNDGDPANNNASGSYNAASGTGVHGGDLAGIEQKLDYIKALGATAIWISPIVLNGNGEYHGYSGRDFYAVDPHWGSLANLKSMVNAAHARGLLVIQDVVVNHGSTLNNINGNTVFNSSGYTLTYSNPARQYAAPFNTNAAMPNLTNLFHNNGAIQDYGSVTQSELGELSGLDDFRTESAYIRTNMANVFIYWVTNVGFDGFRIDTVKHAEMAFWQDWCPRIRAGVTNSKPNFFMFGEVYEGSDAKNGSYTGTMGGGPFKLDATLDFPLYFAANNVFAAAAGNTKQIEDHYNALPANYDPAARDQLVTFLDNHDVSRFLHSSKANGNTNRLALALTFLHTSRGIPCVYSGTEQAFNGGTDPNNREDMFDGQFEQGPSLGDNFNMAHPLFQHIAQLNNFRRLYPALRQGTHVNLWNNPTGPGLFAYARRLGGTQEVFVALNTATSAQTLTNRSTLHPAGTVLVNLLDTNELITVQAGPVTPPLNIPATSAKLFIARPQLLPLDPVITAVSPTHDATNVPPLNPLILEFSLPMDTNSVQAAFSTTPVVPGAFAWSAARDEMTFTPTTNWPGLTLMRVRLADTARAADTTNPLYAAFEARFRTAVFTDAIRPTVTILSPTNNSTVAGMLTISGTAADNLGVAKVEVRLDNRDWQTASGTTSWNLTLNTSNFLNGLRTLAVRATDTSANLSLTNQLTLRFFNVPGAYLHRIAPGSTLTLTNCDAALWLWDRPYTNGSFGYVDGAAGYSASAVTGVCAVAQSLYQRERYSTGAGGFRYRFDCPPGVYETTLFEAETWWTTTNQRVFNLTIEGQTVLSNFDIVAGAGGRNLPLTLAFTNTVADAQLELHFTPVVDNARASGIQARKIADVYSDSDGIPDWWRLAFFNHATGAAGDLSRASDDADGDGAPNVHEFLAGTDPLNPASVFRISHLDLSGGTQVLIECLVASNRSYQLLWQDDPAGGGWVATGAPVAAVSNAVTLVDPSGPTNAARFYRVEIQ
jgi:glycosidase